MNNIRPPRWAEHFLQWYCNPDLLEEIQGDANELYCERLKKNGKRTADLRYIYDVVRFLRWSNIRRDVKENQPDMRTLVQFNFKMATRQVQRDKGIFAIKVVGLSVCLSFALLLTAFMLSEVSYDKFHDNFDRIYRVTSKVDFQDRLTHYAVTPLPIGRSMVEGIPEIERYTRLMYEETPVFQIDDQVFHNETTLAADSNFLKVFSFHIIEGSVDALDQPDQIVLSRRTAKKFFGNNNPIGKRIRVGENFLLHVAAVIEDIPANSHLKFDVLISWDTFERNDEWGNLNAYTYILLRPDALITEVQNKTPALLTTFQELVQREYEATYEPVFEKLTDIHFAPPLDEDIANKASGDNLFILIQMVILFLVTGLINYLNLTLAEITASMKKINIIRIFGGQAGSHHKLLFSEMLFALLIVVPLTAALTFLGLKFSHSHFSIDIDQNVFLNPLFLALLFGFFILLITFSKINSAILSGRAKGVQSLKVRHSFSGQGTSLRKMLVAAQLTFSITMIAIVLIIVDQFRFIRETDKGFDDKNIIVVKVRQNDQALVDAFNEGVRKHDGVAAVDGSTYYPGIIETKYVFQIETDQGMEQTLVPMMLCGVDYFNAMSIQVKEGRGFDSAHPEDPYYSFLINETAAKRFGWKSPLGKKIVGPVDGNGGAFRKGEVIGVVRDFNFATLHSEIEPLIIFLNDDDWASQFIYIKTKPIHRSDLMATIEREFKTFWPDVPFEWEYLDAKYLSLYQTDYKVKGLFEIGVIISILISCLGIFSFSALLASLRTREMGIRKVVGASSSQLFLLHIRSILQFLLLSLLLACPLIYFWSGSWLSNFAYHIKLNPVHFFIPGLLAVIMVLITSTYHAVKSALVNPVETLKCE